MTHPTRVINGRAAHAEGVYGQKWLSLVAVIWLQSISGTNFNFPAYSSQLKKMMGISQLQLNDLAFASDTGKLLGWLSGVAALHLPLWLVLLIGVSLGLLAYGLQYLFLVVYGHNLSYALVFFLTVLAGNSICWINTVCYAAIIGSFAPKSRQVAVGLTASYQGLSANIYTDIVDVVAAHTSSIAGRRAMAYLLLNAFLPAIVAATTAPFIGDSSFYHRDDDTSGEVGGEFVVLFALTIVTGVYAVISSLRSISDQISPVYFTIGIGLLLLAPLVVPVTERVRWWSSRQHKIQVNDVVTSELHYSDDDHRIDLPEGGSGNVGDVHEISGPIPEEVGCRVMLRRLDFWLYYFVYMFGATLGMVYLNNLGQITESRGGSSRTTSSLVSMASAFGFFGRLLPSLLDYYLFSRQKLALSRPALVAVMMVPMAGSFFLLLSSSDLCLYISTAFIGICTGSITSISVSMTADLFGTKNFSVNHNVVVANIPVGSFIFGYLAAVLYRREGDGSGKCIGMECYRKSFIIWGGLCFIGTNLAMLLHARSRHLYSGRGSTGK
ncbi:hypothetical protein SAY86_023117 [Trapa natans]|uniref:Nodulin-like domain-containing protein n=1 Tax=Trapa natans TaxID=22666 RepID=A0AAN7M6F7_TRANT|nr:hypothetical protein SAY86_023117 [Trapa natans]